jgi:hypothetical protein
MKYLKNLIQSAKALIQSNSAGLQDTLLEVICYSPKMPVRLQQQQLLDEAETSGLQVLDLHFNRSQVTINTFRWGKSSIKVLITHGWGSKAADFSDLINRLKSNSAIEVIAFDAPGNGSSEGKLSNLLLYVESVKEVIRKYGPPDIFIGHSLGAMANVIAIQEAKLHPRLVVSMAPIIKLKENFEATLNMIEAPLKVQEEFFVQFEKLFNIPASYFNLTGLYSSNPELNHIVYYDPADAIHPNGYLQEFLNRYQNIVSKSYAGVGHDKIIKDDQVISDIEKLVFEFLGQPQLKDSF